MLIHRLAWIALSTFLIVGCSSNTPSPAGLSLPREHFMTAEFTDFTEPAASDGSLSFFETPDGTLGVTFQVQGSGGGPRFGFGDDLSRARAADLVAGRLVETTGLENANGAGVIGGLQPLQFQRADRVETDRPVLSLRLSMQSESSVLIVIQLGAALVHEGALPADLPPTATLIVSGQLPVSCTTYEAGIGGQFDPAFSSPFCSQLRTELGLDALLAISNSI